MTPTTNNEQRTTERSSTADQRRYIMSLIQYDERTKEELVQWVTEDTDQTSLRSISYHQADRIIKQLTGRTLSGVEGHRTNFYGAFDGKNPRHRKVLSLCITYGWTTVHPKTGKQVANIDRLGNWLQYDDRCPVQKPLKKMTDEELSKIIKALEGMVKWKFK